MLTRHTWCTMYTTVLAGYPCSVRFEMGQIYHWRYKLYICKVSSIMSMGRFFLPITHHTQSSDYTSTIEIFNSCQYDKSTHHLWIKVKVLNTWQMSSLPGTCQLWQINSSHLPAMTMSGGYIYICWWHLCIAHSHDISMMQCYMVSEHANGSGHVHLF